MPLEPLTIEYERLSMEDRPNWRPPLTKSILGQIEDLN